MVGLTLSALKFIYFVSSLLQVLSKRIQNISELRQAIIFFSLVCKWFYFQPVKFTWEGNIKSRLTLRALKFIFEFFIASALYELRWEKKSRH